MRAPSEGINKSNSPISISKMNLQINISQRKPQALGGFTDAIYQTFNEEIK